MAIAKKTTTTKPTKSAVASGQNLGPLARARAALKSVLKEDPSVPLTDSALRSSMAHIPTGSVIVDYLIGGRPNQFGVAPCPGVPRGRILNLYGNAGAGKTTLALSTAASVCNAGGTCVYIDWENEVDPRYAAALGVPVQDEDRFILCQPNTMEDGMKIMVQMASEGVDLIVIDSVGAAVPEDLYHRDVKEEGAQSRIGLVAQKWSQFLPKFKSIITKSNTAVIGISQLRKTIAAGGHGPDSAPQGGESWKFYSAVRMMLRVYSKEKTKQFSAMTGKTEEIVTGTIVMAKLDKCKVSDSAHHELKFYLNSGSGINNTRSVVDLAVAYKIVNKGGAWYEWATAPSGPMRAQGLDSLIRQITADKNALPALFAQVAPKLGVPTVGESWSCDEEPVEEDLFDIIPKSDMAASESEPEPDGDEG